MLEQAQRNGGNFWIGIGFRRPHLNWRVPYRFWQMYNETDIAPAKHQTLGDNITAMAYEYGGNPIAKTKFTKGNGQPSYTMGPNSPLPTEVQVLLRRGY